jgi:hypothetical protein
MSEVVYKPLGMTATEKEALEFNSYNSGIVKINQPQTLTAGMRMQNLYPITQLTQTFTIDGNYWAMFNDYVNTNTPDSNPTEDTGDWLRITCGEFSTTTDFITFESEQYINLRLLSLNYGIWCPDVAGASSQVIIYYRDINGNWIEFENTSQSRNTYTKVQAFQPNVKTNGLKIEFTATRSGNRIYIHDILFLI